MTSHDDSSANDGLLVATFHLGEAVFGIDAHQVQEAAKVGDITRVHHAPPDVVGIRNLRGRIVTVIDLRPRLHLGRVAASPANRILIVDGQGEPIGLLVDSVADAITTRPEDLAPPPPNLHGVQSRNLRGVCQGSGRLVALLDHTALLQSDERAPRAASRENVAA
jgi:purine-binding chemotaxis protein CheW